ncbi:chromate transporter [Mycoplasmopsis canis]|uniref:chromate transporter n=1 Tax=Mycoplasmopsis canis TaxID=29555 RepID=UPI00025B035C|nr:chromate transporter [Mycoplasmopsis canis]EIE39346.1 chromate ion transporter [Mycoplasmopsis canis UF33]
MILALILSIPLLIIISLSVFGGGQVFMPVFEWLWKFLNSLFNLNIDDQVIYKVFTVSNATPGVVSTKFGFLTGYLVSKGEWWGFIAVFLTYLVFCIPAIIVMVLAMKYITKFKSNSYVKNMIIVMKPIVAGIMLSLAVQLFLSVILPEIGFNKGTGADYIKINDSSKNFFVGYRNILLKMYVVLGIGFSFYLARKKKSLFMIIIINVLISLFLFAIPFSGY